MVFLLSLDFDSAIQPAITCALLLMSFRATDFLVMRGIVEGGGMDDADDSATTSTYSNILMFLVAMLVGQ